MKKSLSLLLAIALVVSMFATVVSAAEEQSAGAKLKDLNVITGTSTGLDEDKDWLRKDVTILLSRLYGVEADAKAHANTHGFSDLNAKDYNGVVSWAKEEGLFNGKTETTFGPNDNITNGQFATVILRALGQDQKDEAKNLEKAIELKLLPEGTKQTDAAKRGLTYSAIVAALDVEVDGKKLGTKLGLKGYEIADLAITSASAVVAKSIVVNFNEKVKEINVKDVTVKDAEGNSVLVEKVSIDGTTATIALAAALTSGKEYTVSIASATGVEANALANGTATFKYTKGVPASVAFKSTVVVEGKTVGFVVKDAAGNDISADYPVSEFDVVSSNDAVIESGSSNTLKAGASASGKFAVVSLTLTDDESVTTGNVTINVVSALDVKLKNVKSDATNNVIYLTSTGGAQTANTKFEVYLDNASAAAFDQDDLASLDVKFTSGNPAVATVNQNGVITGVAKGTATINVKISYDGKTADASFTVTVREAQKATSFTIDKTNVTVVKDVYYITETVTVTVLDQHGDAIENASVDVNVSKSAAATVNTVADGDLNNDSAAVDATTLTSNDKGKVTFDVVAKNATGSATITVKVDGIAKTQKVSAKSVAAATAKGYEVRVDEKKLDSNTTDTASGKTFAAEAVVSVFVKDTNGNRIDTVSGFVLDLGTNSIVDFKSGSTDTLVAKSNQEGTAKVKVLVNNVVVDTLTLEVAPSSPKYVKTVTQAKSGITIANTGDLHAALFGDNGAFVAKNAAGDSVEIATSVNANEPVVVSSNTAVVTSSVAGYTEADFGTETGTAVLTVVINGTVYTITVNVTE